jgi:hypothetical protein
MCLLSTSFVPRPDQDGLSIKKNADYLIIYILLFFFEVLGLELKGFILIHSTSPIFVKGFSR